MLTNLTFIREACRGYHLKMMAFVISFGDLFVRRFLGAKYPLYRTDCSPYATSFWNKKRGCSWIYWRIWVWWSRRKLDRRLLNRFVAPMARSNSGHLIRQKKLIVKIAMHVYWIFWSWVSSLSVRYWRVANGAFCRGCLLPQVDTIVGSLMIFLIYGCDGFSLDLPP